MPDFTMSQYATKEALYKAKAEYFESVAADRLEMIGALGGDISRMQQVIGELQTENARLRRIETALKEKVAV